MAEEPTSSLTNKFDSVVNKSSNQLSKATSTVTARQSRQMAGLGHLLAGTMAVGAALMTASGWDWMQLMEAQVFSAFFQLRGPVLTPPEGIVILAIDDESLSLPKQYYQAEPRKYAFFEPIQALPYRRAVYGQLIDKLIKSGARSVALDIMFDTPSSNGAADDRQLEEALQRHGDKVTLAALYQQFETDQGVTNQLAQPQEIFRTGRVAIGSVNFPLEVDGKVHRLASEYPKLLAENEGFVPIDKIPSFDEAVLRTAGINFPKPKGDRIYFYGPGGTFEQYPLWHVFDPENWNSHLQQGKVFQNKIVLVGATAQLANDYHSVAIAKSWLTPERMAGIEIHANAIATLMEGKTIARGIQNPVLRGVFVLFLVASTALVTTRSKGGIVRFFVSIALSLTWGAISYVLFIHGQIMLPTTTPAMAIALGGLSYLGTEIARESIKRRQLLVIFQKYQSFPVVQKIISEQDDLQDLLKQRDLEISGKILGGRYKVIKVLGSGGFSETYVAEDSQRPGNPLCVVKQLKPANTKSEQLEIARRLFSSEAQTLEKLGTYSQIPQLLAYFEEDEEFYLIQEYILGHPLSQELSPGKPIQEGSVITILQDLLQTIAFVHENDVIHRDIKPSNIIRRDSDRKLVLIDFGAVKEATTQIFNNQEQSAFTIGIGTKGYAPSEQCFGRPQFSSDIYAIGMIGIKALTGIAPHEINRDESGELKWLNRANVSQELAEILNRMVMEDFKQRYQSAREVLGAINELPVPTDEQPVNTLSLEDSDIPTTPWIGDGD
jgi:CHASE2 domain-containing sensor protein/tRNA A-37 threonylcarbamoyl transferase component Bud32